LLAAEARKNVLPHCGAFEGQAVGLGASSVWIRPAC